MKKTLFAVAAVALLVCPLAAQMDADDIDLLKKRVEIAEKILKIAETQHQAGAVTGGFPGYADAHIRLAEAKNKLYLASGEKEKRIAACEEKLKWAKKKHEAAIVVNAVSARGSTTLPQLIQNLESELTVYEAEFDLKKAKKESAVNGAEKAASGLPAGRRT